jgi:beta-barrel assembly-enhancing protease
MKKVLLQIVIIVAVFLGIWLALSRVNWMKIFRVEHFHTSTEQKLGDLFWKSFSSSADVLDDNSIKLPVDSILNKICVSNDIDTAGLKLHIVKSEGINAFALPNKHLVVFSGLITSCENEEELAGVLSHELAHIELHHVMKKLIKEVGLSMLISMTTGKGGSDGINKTARMLSSTAFDRNLEKEADIKAVEYLSNTSINPEHLANFLYRLADKEPGLNKHLTWISTHPETKERAEYIIRQSEGKKIKDRSILSKQGWHTLLENIEKQ